MSAPRGRVWLVAGVLGLAACQSGTAAPATPGQASDRPAPATSSTTTSSSQNISKAFHNPVYATNFPDPMIFRGPEGIFWAVATNGHGSNVQLLSSKSLTRWKPEPDALPELPAWSSPGKVWAPEVAVHSRSRYVMYYTTQSPNPAIQCIGVAVSAKPQGPYVDRSTGPLVCEKDHGGSIDPHPFRAADGKRYLFWKNDGNAVGQDTWISVQGLDASGMKLVGKPRQLIKQDLPWEAHLIEAPFVWEHDGKFHLFYSANSFDSDQYAVGHAVAETPLGPFTKSGDPVLVSNDVAAGPGHCALVKNDGRLWMVYHAWRPDSIGSEDPGRTMWLSEVTFGADGSVTVVPPTVNYPPG